MMIERFDAKAILKGNINERNMIIQNNDEIYVEEAAVYYLYGYVNTPGEDPLTRKLSVQQALAAGGGISPLGSDWRIQIKRRLPDGRVVETWVGLDDEVQPSDTVVVNQRFF
jgi:polysaccharide export outer membrane protein